jgi:hypothetical protein
MSISEVMCVTYGFYQTSKAQSPRICGVFLKTACDFPLSGQTKEGIVANEGFPPLSYISRQMPIGMHHNRRRLSLNG